MLADFTLVTVLDWKPHPGFPCWLCLVSSFRNLGKLSKGRLAQTSAIFGLPLVCCRAAIGKSLPHPAPVGPLHHVVAKGTHQDVTQRKQRIQLYSFSNSEGNGTLDFSLVMFIALFSEGACLPAHMDFAGIECQVKKQAHV